MKSLVEQQEALKTKIDSIQNYVNGLSKKILKSPYGAIKLAHLECLKDEYKFLMSQNIDK